MPRTRFPPARACSRAIRQAVAQCARTRRLLPRARQCSRDELLRPAECESARVISPGSSARVSDRCAARSERAQPRARKLVRESSRANQRPAVTFCRPTSGAYALAQRELEIRGLNGLVEEEALTQLAAEILQAVQLLLQLDPFGDRLQLQRFAQRDHRARERRLRVASAHIVDERLVDLEDVDREALQVSERRVAGAEIVDRETNAERLERVQPLENRRALLHEHTLGDLEHEMARIEPAVAERAPHIVHHVLALQLVSRDVDRERERLSRRALSACQPDGLPARLAHHPAAERNDQPRLLGQRNERERREHPARGMIPAHERLDAGDLARLQQDDRLIEQRELVAVDRVAQIGLELEPLHRLGVHARFVAAVLSLPALLRDVHRHVRVAQQVARGVIRVRDGDPDARGREHFLPLEMERVPHQLEHALDDGHGRIVVRRILDEDRELVAAEARDRVRRAHRGLHPLATCESAACRPARGRASR